MHLFKIILLFISISFWTVEPADARMPRVYFDTIKSGEVEPKEEFSRPSSENPNNYTPNNQSNFMPNMKKSSDTAHTQNKNKAQALRNFWTYMTILSILFLGGSYLLGKQVQERGWKVGYTRKAQALVLYFLPYVAMHGPSPYSAISTASISLGVFIMLQMLMSEPIRKRAPVAMTAFAAIDRPEDRPLTLTWLNTSIVASWGIICLWLWFLPETTGYLFVALFISGVGDAIAEPIGLKFGRHPYRTSALWTHRKYIRTYEGSAAVFASGILAVSIVHGFVFDAQTLVAFAVFPIVGAIAEAKSPHTWDQPFIIASCALAAIGMSFI